MQIWQNIRSSMGGGEICSGCCCQRQNVAGNRGKSKRFWLFLGVFGAFRTQPLWELENVMRQQLLAAAAANLRFPWFSLVASHFFCLQKWVPIATSVERKKIGNGNPIPQKAIKRIFIEFTSENSCVGFRSSFKATSMLSKYPTENSVVELSPSDHGHSRLGTNFSIETPLLEIGPIPSILFLSTFFRSSSSSSSKTKINCLIANGY